MVKASSRSRFLVNVVGTPLTITTSLVVGVTGLMLWLKVGTQFVKGLHEWLGVLMVAACVLHVIRNWSPIARYARQRALWVATGVTALATVGLILPAALGAAGHGDRRPTAASMQVVRAVEQAPLSQVAQLAGCTPQELVARLDEQGMKVDSAAMTLEQIAKSCDRPTTSVVDAIFANAGRSIR